MRQGTFRFFPSTNPVTINLAFTRTRGHALGCDGAVLTLDGKRFRVADTKKIEDKAERKKVKRAARKKAAPKAKRTTPRGSQKKKVKKLARGQSKR